LITSTVELTALPTATEPKETLAGDKTNAPATLFCAKYDPHPDRATQHIAAMPILPRLKSLPCAILCKSFEFLLEFSVRRRDFDAADWERFKSE